jgi:EpsI family protein
MTQPAKVMVLLFLTAVAHRALVAAQASPSAVVGVPLTEVPARILGYRQFGADIPIDPHVNEILETPDVLMRNYTSRQGVPVQLTIVRSGATRRSLHFPEVCLTGQGWEVREQYSAPVGVLFVAKRLVIFKGDTEVAVLYWFMTSDHVTGSYFMNSVFWAREQLLLRPSKAMMIKLSAPVGSAGPESTFGQLDDFAQGLTPILQERFN